MVLSKADRLPARTRRGSARTSYLIEITYFCRATGIWHEACNAKRQSDVVSADGAADLVADRIGNAAALGEGRSRAPGGRRFFISGSDEKRANGGEDLERQGTARQSRGPSTPMTTTRDTGTTKRRGLNRRTFLKASAGTAALLGAVQSQFPFGAHVAQAAGPEVTKAILGYIALMDASPLVIAKEKGFFAKHGMPDVEVVEAGVVGRDARQHRARLREERHRRRAHSHADALSDLDRQGDAEQRADADVHPGAAQSRCAGDLGRATNTRISRSPPTPRRSRPPSRRRRPPARR